MWDLTGNMVTAVYLGNIPVFGKVTESRVCYGDRVKHYVTLSRPIKVFGDVRDTVVVETRDIIECKDTSGKVLIRPR